MRWSVPLPGPRLLWAPMERRACAFPWRPPRAVLCPAAAFSTELFLAGSLGVSGGQAGKLLPTETRHQTPGLTCTVPTGHHYRQVGALWRSKE